MDDTKAQKRSLASAGSVKGAVRRRSPSRSRGLRAWFVESYASADPRSLAVFRILFALVLIHDVARRWPDLADHYSNAGWLTNHFAMFRPMSSDLFSLYLAFSTPEEVKVLVLFQLAVNVCLLVGYRTKLMQILAFVLIVSLNSRNIMLENGGFVVVHLIALWSLFLPLGRRYSVDALCHSLRARREATLQALNETAQARERTQPVVSLAVSVLILQFALIYYLNVVHKTGESWHDGSAVYYFFQQDRMVTLFGAWLRDHVGSPFVWVLTWSTLTIESLIALCLLSPIQPARARMIGWALVACLHFGIDVVVQLGPFSYAMFVVHAIFIPREFWNYLAVRQRRALRPLVLYLVKGSGLGFACARVLVRVLPRRSLTCVALGPAEEYSGPSGTFREPVSFAEIEQELVVTDRARGQRWRGGAAVARLGSVSLPLRLCLAWLELGAIRAVVDGWLRRALLGRTRLAAAFGLEPRESDVFAEPKSPGRRWLDSLGGLAANAVLIFFVVCCTSQVLVENRAVPEWLKPKTRPEWMTQAVVYPRLFQGWSMFAPDPPKDDGKIVVEGRTKDGRRFDPLTQKEPDYGLNPRLGFQMNQLWGDFHRRIWQARFRVYWNGVRDYLRNHHRITGKPENELSAFEVYYVSEMVPSPGAERPPPRKERLFAWGNMPKPSTSFADVKTTRSSR